MRDCKGDVNSYYRFYALVYLWVCLSRNRFIDIYNSKLFASGVTCDL